VSDDDDAIMQLFQKYCEDRLQKIKEYELVSQSKPYPGKKVLDKGKNLLRFIMQIEYSTEFFKALSDQRESYLDFADDFEPVKAFYSGEQKKIFDDALDKMRIYDDSKTFIVDENVESCVADIKDILKMAAPYASIPKLPGLIKQFTDAYLAVLDGMSGPIYEAIEDARKRVLGELEDKSYKDELSARFQSMFSELKDKADHCNNVATFQNIKVEADALKMRLLGEITRKDTALAAAKPPAAVSTDHGEATTVTSKPTQPKPLKVKSVSIRNINTGGTWQVKSKAEIDVRLEELRRRLYNEMEDGAILNIEF
jgi:hypothetical protein